jgi:CubicO group peptidase (beta-lactamase class C family)
VSKQFTAMAMLILEKEGKLSLDDPIRKYIPEMPAYADRVTLRRALSQTSGLRDLYVMMGQSGRAFDGDTVDALRIITRSAEPNYEPGARYLYTNSGWILAAQIVYRLTGKTLAQFAEERIFAPLGMRDTRYLSDAGLNIPNLAEGYAPSAGGGYRRLLSTYDGSIMGAGAVQTTVEDFGRWLDNYDAATVGGRDVITAMTTPTKLNDGAPAAMGGTGFAYALGLGVGSVRGLNAISHGGSWSGYRAHFLRFPDQRVAVATFCNLTTSGPDSLARKVAGIYLGDRMQPDSAALWIATLAGSPRAETSSAALRPFTGVWRNVERGEVRRTRVLGDTLVTTGGARTALVSLGGGRFRSTTAEVRFEGELGAPARMVVRVSGETITYTRADSVTLTPARLAEFAGSYRNDEVEATHVWKIEKEQLVLYVNDRRQGVLEPTYRDGFLRGSTVIDVQRDGRGRIAGFTVQAGRVRNLRFTRVR